MCPLVTGSANNIALLLGTLQNNGGQTLTQLPGTGSLALDRIPNGATVNNNGTVYVCNQNGQLLDTDQRDDPRPSVPSGNCDVGAVEVNLNFGAQKPILVSPTTGSTITTNPPKLVWNPVPGATSYVVLMDTSNPPSTTLTTVNSTSYTLPSVMTIGTYYWQVYAVNAASEQSAGSDVSSFTVASTANAAPIRNYFTTDPPTLIWNAVSWATAYHIQVSTDRNFMGQMYIDDDMLGSDELTIQTTHLDNGAYYWRVKAKQPNGTWGAWSAPESFTVNVP